MHSVKLEAQNLTAVREWNCLPVNRLVLMCDFVTC